jgi:hypothetical protein
MFFGNWNDQDVVWLHVGGSAIGKTVFGGQDSSNTIARHFANFINAIFDGAWASATGSVLTITAHSFSSVWQFHVYTELPASKTGSGHATVTGDLQGGTYGVKWVIDPTQTPVLNRAFRDWSTDFFGQLKANNMSVVCSFSQELVAVEICERTVFSEEPKMPATSRVDSPSTSRSTSAARSFTPRRLSPRRTISRCCARWASW